MRTALALAALLLLAAAPLASATHFDRLCTELWAEDPPGWQPTCSIASDALHVLSLVPCTLPVVEVHGHRIDPNGHVACV